jgi:hypothetical protein
MTIGREISAKEWGITGAAGFDHPFFRQRDIHFQSNHNEFHVQNE